jgi:hypothetical protein
MLSIPSEIAILLKKIRRIAIPKNMSLPNKEIDIPT